MIQSFDSIDELSTEVADRFVELAASTIQQSGIFRVTLSGGSTPRRLYQMLAERSLPWENIEWFWGDERNVPHEHSDSNYRMVREALLDRLPATSVHAYPVPVNVNDPATAASEYESMLRDKFADQSQPAFDLALLGMGDDAHTASLFPETDALTRDDRWFVENYVPKFEQTRYTLTAPAINSARNRWFMVSGAGKRDALAKVLSDNDHRPMLFPSQLIQDPLWFVTTDALA